MGRSKLRHVRPILLGVFAVAVATAALAVALRGLNWTAFRAQVHHLDWRWLTVAVAFDTASYAAQGVRWHCLLKQASLWQTTRAIYAGLFLNEVVPLRPGEAVRAWLAARDLGVGLLTVAPTMLTERLMDGVWLTGALLAALAIAPLPPSLARAAWIVIMVMTALLVTALIARQDRYPFLAEIRSGLSNKPALLASGFFLASQGVAFWAVTRASHLSLSVAAAFVVMTIVRVGTMVPGAPANLGTHQFSTVLGLSLYGVPQTEAAGFSLVVFVILTAPLLAIGFAACLNAGLDWQTWRAASRPAEPDPHRGSHTGPRFSRHLEPLVKSEVVAFSIDPRGMGERWDCGRSTWWSAGIRSAVAESNLHSHRFEQSATDAGIRDLLLPDQKRNANPIRTPVFLPGTFVSRRARKSRASARRLHFAVSRKSTPPP